MLRNIERRAVGENATARMQNELAIGERFFINAVTRKTPEKGSYGGGSLMREILQITLLLLKQLRA